MSIQENPFNLISLVVTIITGVVVAILYITTRFGKGEVKGAISQVYTQQMSKSLETIQDEFKESQKELKEEVKNISRDVNSLTNTLNLQQYTSAETKQVTAEIQRRLNDLERRYYELERRINNGRAPVGH